MQPHVWFKTLSFQNCVSEWYFGGVRWLCHHSSYPFLLFCSVFWLLWWENERVPVFSSGMETGGLWWSVLLLQLTHLALCALCVENTQRQPVLGVRCWVLCGTPHCTVLWHWRPGSVFPHQPYWDHPPHSSSCPGIQLWISTPNGSSSLVSQGIQIGAGIASLCGHSVSPQRLRTHTSHSFLFHCWGLSELKMWGHLSLFPCSFGLQQWYQEESQGTSYCFVGQGGGGLLVHLARGKKSCCSGNSGKANNPWPPQL